ncbi:peptidase S10, serine carboxypeptidase [Blyttiomyces helicus]|uniref:Carboxypeptidase n=1 Tax=Blyttiomyces helicus TaxID=388810 RepID=A0A4P9WGK7_9FUNG|nr:peptidase S10, serine carboxypeptidase [Blyttiomyces helicus]|eukprot:RKO91045.1 peptidase S10, serine carboxypeptidase [Blyttiomyces helicus]
MPRRSNGLKDGISVEQPIGTGFAFGNGSDFAKNEITVGENLYTFLDQFYDIFPETLAYRLYITGESYAGMYIPYIAATLVEKNRLTNGRPIPLAGILVQDGLWNITIQNDINLAGHFFEETNFFSENKTYLDQIYETAVNCSGINPYLFNFWNFPNNTNGCWVGNIPQSYLNVYKPGMYFNPYDIYTDASNMNNMGNSLIDYLSSYDVQEAIHVSSERNKTQGSTPGWWTICSNSSAPVNVYNIFGTDSPGSQQLLPKIIESGIATFITEGTADYIIHYKGIEAVIGNTTWNGAKGFEHPHVVDLYPAPLPGSRVYNHTVAGKITSERGLTYVTVINAGHEIPFYKPAAALSTLKHLLNAKHTYKPGKGVNFDLAKIGRHVNVTVPSSAAPFPNNTVSRSLLFRGREAL